LFLALVIRGATKFMKDALVDSCVETMPKARIVDELGEQELLLPVLVNQALAANDRAKYLMTLLQIARERADHPDLMVTDLKQERLTYGVADGELDLVVEHSRKEGVGAYLIPRVRRIHDMLVEDVHRMLAPLQARNSNGDQPAATYEEHLRLVLSQAPPPAEDRLGGEYIDRITSGRRDAGDSLHLLVMDLHKELNRLQQRLSTETIDGAQVYGIGDDDRALIAAFMAGINQTRELKFDHPGLGTTATRSGARLVIQNDIGMTEAHVLVVHVEPTRVTLTYTDVHLERLIFFQNLFDRFVVRWEDTVSRRAQGLRELYHLCLGTFTTNDRDSLLSYLTFLGSRLVFLIDWNRARKRLRRFAPRRVCLSGSQQDRRFHAGLALARFGPGAADPIEERFEQQADFLSNQLIVAIQSDPSQYPWLVNALNPIGDLLAKALAKIVLATRRAESERSLAARLIANYGRDRPLLLGELADLVKESEARLGAPLLPVLVGQADRVVPVMEQELARKPEPNASDEDKDRLARRQANAAAVLLQIGRADKIWPLLHISNDPSVRTFLIHALGPLGVSPLPLISRLEHEDDLSSRRALLLCLGEFSEEKLPLKERQLLIDKLKRWYRDDPDPGVHSALDWLLRRWQQHAEVDKIDGEKALQRGPADRRWYVNGQGQTMAIIPGPVDFQMGSPPNEPDRNPGLETMRPRHLDHSFAIGTKEVTVGQFRKFLQAHPDLRQDPLALSTQNSTDPDGPWWA
jgi:hypothetical protein